MSDILINLIVHMNNTNTHDKTQTPSVAVKHEPLVSLLSGTISTVFATSLQYIFELHKSFNEIHQPSEQD